MNIRMDKIAGDCRIAHPSPLPAKAHLGNQVSLTLNGHIVTTKFTFNYVLPSQHHPFRTTSSGKRTG
jgi:hypothetical protein